MDPSLTIARGTFFNSSHVKPSVFLFAASQDHTELAYLELRRYYNILMQ